MTTNQSMFSRCRVSDNITSRLIIGTRPHERKAQGAGRRGNGKEGSSGTLNCVCGSLP